MTEEDDDPPELAVLNGRLGAGFGYTVDGQTIKGYLPDADEPGQLSKTYLGADDCRALAEAFLKVAERLEAGRRPRRSRR